MKYYLMAYSAMAGIALACGLLISVDAVASETRTVLVAPNVYAFIGTGGTVSRDNRGRTANAGFIVGSEGVVVVDTGISYRHGQRLKEAINSVTDQPVKLVILTHAVREFVFGAHVFEQEGAMIAAHRETRDLMTARCAHCLAQLVEGLGSELDGTKLVLPSQVFDESTSVRVAGVEIDIIYAGWASTPGAIAIYHNETGTLLAGGLVTVAHVPTIRDSDFDGWMNALQMLSTLPVNKVIPGFGPPAGADAILAMQAYLEALDARVRTLYDQTSSLLETVDRADLAAFAHWRAYEPNHRRNALHRQLQLEIEDLGGDPRSTAMPSDSP